MQSAITKQFHTVLGVWRYPVKSMMGEELNASGIDELGLLGDRAHALVDEESGAIVSAKNPKKWPDFFSYRAAYTDPITTRSDQLPPVLIQLPDGSTARTDRHDVNEVLSKSLPRRVVVRRRAPAGAALEQYWPERDAATGSDGVEPVVTREKIAGDAPTGTFFDYAVVHLLTTASLEYLQQAYPQGRIEARRFRPNIIVGSDPEAKGFLENEWVGRIVSIGPEVLLQVTDPCPRCVMPTLAQGDLPRDPQIMRTMALNSVYVPFAQKPLPSVGVYAKVLRSGTIRRGDRVSVQ